MKGGILRFLVTAAAVPLCGYFMNGVTVLEYGSAILVGLILAAIYTLLRPLLRLVLAVINFCLMGLVNVAVDAWLVWTVAGLVENSVVFESFWWALAVSLVINVLRTLADVLTGNLKK